MELAANKNFPVKLVKKKRWFEINKNQRVLYLLLIPGILYYILFHYFPMYGVIIAFKDYNIFEGVWKSPWVGLDNFKQLFETRVMYTTILNTIRLNILSLIFGFPVPIIIALMLNEIKNKTFVSLTQSILYLPHFFSWVIIGGIIISILSPKYGLVNQILQSIGIEPIYFMSDKKWWVITYVFSGIWKEAGWGAIIYVAALTGVDLELYNAAKIDGANRWQQLWNVTFPGIRPTIATMLILRVSSLLSIGFEQPMILTNPMVIDYADVISTYIYSAGIRSGQFSLTTSLGFFQSVIGLIMVYTANWIIRKLGEEGIF